MDEDCGIEIDNIIKEGGWKTAHSPINEDPPVTTHLPAANDDDGSTDDSAIVVPSNRALGRSTFTKKKLVTGLVLLAAVVAIIAGLGFGPGDDDNQARSSSAAGATAVTLKDCLAREEEAFKKGEVAEPDVANAGLTSTSDPTMETADIATNKVNGDGPVRRDLRGEWREDFVSSAHGRMARWLVKTADPEHHRDIRMLECEELLAAHHAASKAGKATKSAKSEGNSTCPSSKGAKSDYSNSTSTKSGGLTSGDAPAKAGKSVGESTKAAKSSKRCPAVPSLSPTLAPTLALGPEGCIASTCGLYNTTVDFPCGECGEPICAAVTEDGTNARDGPGLCVKDSECKDFIPCDAAIFNGTLCPFDWPCVTDTCCARPSCVQPFQLCNATGAPDPDLVDLLDGLFDIAQLETVGGGTMGGIVW